MSRRTALAALATTALGARRAFADEPLAIVAAANLPVSGLSKAELKRLFLGEPVSAGPVKLVPFNLPPSSPERQRFDHTVLGFSADQTSKYWIDRRIRGQGSPPRTVPSPDVMIMVTAKFPGAVAYVPMRMLSGGAVKALEIDGKKPTDIDYLLRSP